MATVFWTMAVQIILKTSALYRQCKYNTRLEIFALVLG